MALAAAGILALAASSCGTRSDLGAPDGRASDAGLDAETAPGRDAATPPAPGGGAALADASTGIDAVVALADAGMCAPGRDGISVELVPVSTATLCAYGHHEGAVITAVSAEPASNGVRLRADFCPDADADCRCDIVVAGTGPVDVTRLPFPRANTIVDVDRQHLVIRKSPTCRCDGCGCDMFLALVASHEDPDTARDLPPEIAFARGSVSCPTTATCERTDSWRLRTRTLGFDVELDQGTEMTLGSVVVRNVADAVGFDTCAACAECGAVRGLFLAWVDAARAGP